MGLYNWAFKNLILQPSLLLSGRPVLKYLDQLEKSQWYSPVEIQELQTNRLKKLLQYSYDYIPYYKRLMDESGINPALIYSIEDIKKLPVLTKQLIIENTDNLKSTEFDRIPKELRATGGSSGNPLQYWLDIKALSMSTAARYRGWGMAGFHIGDKIVTIGGSSLYNKKKTSITMQAFHYLERNTFFSGIELSEDKLSRYTKFLILRKPKFVFGYASSLFIWAEYLLRHNIAVDSVQAILPTSEVLLPHYKEAIEAAFNCRTFNGYGARDGNVTAFECSFHNGFHISTETAILEILDPETGKSTEGVGEIVVTDLYNYCFPLIRYKIGDLGILSQDVCPCGRGLPILKSVEGRTGDIFRFANGRTLTGPAFTVLFSKLSFSNYQLVQTSRSSVTVRVVKAKNYDPKDTKTVIETLRHHIGPEIRILYEEVPEISNQSSGKRAYFVSELTNSE